MKRALACVAQLVLAIVLYTERVTSLIPGQGTYRGCGFDPWSELIQEAADLYFPLTSMFLAPPHSILPPSPFPLL